MSADKIGKKTGRGGKRANSGGVRPGSGRKPGSPNKVTASVKEALVAAFDQMGGTQALVVWGMENQTEFYKLWAKLLPQEVKNEVSGPNGGTIPTSIEIVFRKPDGGKS
jgi:hypothetical protein